ncbi:MAG: PilZ domain-containing protein [Oscillospiraceae bacterium]|nr:PilZ domain-containing protein [Oscillospiraceae bacterium]
MNLGHIERGTKLKIFEECEGRAISEEMEAVFRFLETGKLFVVHCSRLFETYEELSKDACLNISFPTGPNMNTFTGRAVEKQRSDGMLMIEQLTDIDTYSRREYERDELRIKVQVYGIPESKLSSPRFGKPSADAEMVDMTYDISAGGICVITNTLLSSKYDPYYLLDFSLTVADKDSFLLPAKLVRRSNYPRTKIGRYDYGFQFIFDNMPDEKRRLSRSILSRKLLSR